jgi:hypothetical protein
MREDQKGAVLNSLNNRFNFIWGPPGTGKTFSIAEILFQMLKNKKRVMVASNTHKAVDEVLKKLLGTEKDKNNPYLHSDIVQNLLNNQQILRWGGSKRFKEESDIGKQVTITMDELVAQKSALLEKELMELKSSVSQSKSRLSWITKLLEVEDFLTKSTSEYEALEKDNKELTSFIATLEIRKDRFEASVSEMENQMKTIEASISVDKKELEYLQVHNHAVKEIIRIEAEKIASENEVVALGSQLNEIQSRKDSLLFSQKQLREEITQYENSSWIANLLSGRDKQQMLRQIGQNEVNMNELESRSKNVTSEIAKQNTQIKKKVANIGTLKGIISDNGYENLTIEESEKAYEDLEEKIRNQELELGDLNDPELVFDLGETRKLLYSKQYQYANNVLRLKEISTKKQEIESDKRLLEELNELKEIDAKNECEKLDKSIEETNKKIEAITTQLNLVKEQILNDAKLIGCTLTKAMMSCEPLLSNPPDVVLVDEFSMVGVALLYFVTGLSKSQVIFVGDHKQLPPIYTSENELVKQYLGSDIMSLLMGETKQADTVSFLEVQRRMNPDISRIVNLVSYDEKLKDGVTKAEKRLKKPFMSDNAITLVDTSNINPWSSKEKDLESGSRVNFYSALLGIRLIEKIYEDKISEEVGYITPYAGQARLVNKILEEKKLKEFCKAGTVHRYQGDEKEVIIFDLTDSNPHTPSGLLKQFMWNAKDKVHNHQTQARQLINVACSRAKFKLIIIANLKYFENKFSTSSRMGDEPLVKIFELIKDKYPNDILPAENMLSYDKKTILNLRKQSGGFGQEELTNDKLPKDLEFINESTFYQRLEKDLIMAKDQVLILSPFIYSSRIKKLRDLFTRIVNDGIEIIIYTKPLKEQISVKDTLESLDLLSNMGVINVLFRKKMHEKIVIIDDEITYVGSLNPLSQMNSKELMIRTTDKGYLKGLESFIRGIRDGTREVEEYDNKEGVFTEEDAAKEFRKLRRLICYEKRVHFGQVLRNATIAELIEKRPISYDDLQKIAEFARPNASVRGFEDRILSIVQHIQ